VLKAQEAAMAKLRAGAYYEDLNETARSIIRSAGHSDDFYHGLGHFVGLNVHDIGDYSKPLPAGAVLTIEPGVYLADKGFGIRIEDEFLVTATGYERLSAGIPRTVSEIEGFMRSRD
jgi:Xaa-Pro aminopeptidase